MNPFSAEPNRNIIEYLKYYCDSVNQFDFAVMLKGAWGAGKTYLIKAFLEQLGSMRPNSKRLYVSLYGITSFHQIDDELFRQLHPVLASKGAKIAAAIGKGLLKATLKIDIGDKEELAVSSQIPDIDLRDYIVSPTGCLLVFDDLERCSIKVPEV